MKCATSNAYVKATADINEQPPATNAFANTTTEMKCAIAKATSKRLSTAKATDDLHLDAIDSRQGNCQKTGICQSNLYPTSLK